MQLTFLSDNITYTTDFKYKMLQPESLMELNSIAPGICSKHNYTFNDLEKDADGANLDQVQKEDLLALLETYIDIFSECPGRVSNYEHEIVMCDDNPFYVKSYLIPFVHRNDVEIQLQEMLEWGISAEKTEYISPLVTVTKRRRIRESLS